MITSIKTCRFKRLKESKWEKGILLNEGQLGIIDENGKSVRSLWNYETSIGFEIYDLRIGGAQFSKSKNYIDEQPTKRDNSISQ